MHSSIGEAAPGERRCDCAEHFTDGIERLNRIRASRSLRLLLSAVASRPAVWVTRNPRVTCTKLPSRANGRRTSGTSAVAGPSRAAFSPR